MTTIVKSNIPHFLFMPRNSMSLTKLLITLFLAYLPTCLPHLNAQDNTPALSTFHTLLYDSTAVFSAATNVLSDHPIRPLAEIKEDIVRTPTVLTEVERYTSLQTSFSHCRSLLTEILHPSFYSQLSYDDFFTLLTFVIESLGESKIRILNQLSPHPLTIFLENLSLHPDHTNLYTRYKNGDDQALAFIDFIQGTITLLKNQGTLITSRVLEDLLKNAIKAHLPSLIIKDFLYPYSYEYKEEKKHVVQALYKKLSHKDIPQDISALIKKMCPLENEISENLYHEIASAFTTSVTTPCDPDIIRFLLGWKGKESLTLYSVKHALSMWIKSPRPHYEALPILLTWKDKNECSIDSTTLFNEVQSACRAEYENTHKTEALLNTIAIYRDNNTLTREDVEYLITEGYDCSPLVFHHFFTYAAQTNKNIRKSCLERALQNAASFNAHLVHFLLEKSEEEKRPFSKKAIESALKKSTCPESITMLLDWCTTHHTMLPSHVIISALYSLTLKENEELITRLLQWQKFSDSGLSADALGKVLEVASGWIKSTMVQKILEWQTTTGKLISLAHKQKALLKATQQAQHYPSDQIKKLIPLLLNEESHHAEEAISMNIIYKMLHNLCSAYSPPLPLVSYILTWHNKNGESISRQHMNELLLKALKNKELLALLLTWKDHHGLGLEQSIIQRILTRIAQGKEYAAPDSIQLLLYYQSPDNALFTEQEIVYFLHTMIHSHRLFLSHTILQALLEWRDPAGNHLSLHSLNKAINKIQRRCAQLKGKEHKATRKELCKIARCLKEEVERRSMSATAE